MYMSVWGVTIINKKEAMNVKKSEERDIEENWREGNGKICNFIIISKVK